MLTSRMFSTAFRFFAGLTVFSFIAALVLGFTSEVQSPIDRVLGPLSLGWKGGVGNHFGYAFFVGLFAVSAGMAGILVALRDADPEAEAEVVNTETVPLTRAPAGVNYLPALAALAFVFGLIGLATDSTGLAVVGAAVLVCVTFVWTLRAWAERATGDDATNAELYHRFMEPLRVPLVSIIAVAFVAIGFSRVLLAVSKVASVWIFGLVALVFFLIACLLALKPNSAKWVTTGLVILGAIAMLAAAIAGAVIGERDFEHHGEDHSSMVAPNAAYEGAQPSDPVNVSLGESA